MSPVWRTIVALVLVLPIGAFAVGSLVTSGAAEPERRDPIVIRDEPDDRSTDPTPTRPPRPTRTPGPTVVPPRPDDRDDGQDDRDDGQDDRDDDRDDRRTRGGEGAGGGDDDDDDDGGDGGGEGDDDDEGGDDDGDDDGDDGD